MRNHAPPTSFWSLSPEDSLAKLNSSLSGLSSRDAKRRLSDFGLNVLPDNPRLSRLKIFLSQLKSPLIFILIIAGLVTVFLREFADALFIFIAVIINSLLGFYQENKAENALAALKTYLKRRAVVLRDGHPRLLDSRELVPGDVINISAGDHIPADARLLSASDFQVDESVLTGESLPVKKSLHSVVAETVLAERVNMIWSGTLVFSGTARALITATGPQTEFGRIAALVKESTDESTPLQLAIKDFTLKISAILFVLTALLFSLCIYAGVPLFDMFLTAVAVAVSAIPEGLPIALTVILAIGVERMARRRAVVRKLLAAETLGSTTIVLTDKTGTLTKAQTSLDQVIPARLGQNTSRQLLELAVLNVSVFTDVSLAGGAGRHLESALLQGSAHYKISPRRLVSQITVIDTLPFNSRDKFSAVLVKFRGQSRIIILGAPDLLIQKSNLSALSRRRLMTQLNELASNGAKLIGVATAKPKSPNLGGFSLARLSFAGLISFRDPVRREVKSALKKAERLGVKTVIITGDHQGTAEAVARQIGFNLNDKLIITGQELTSLSDDRLRSQLEQVAIFARVTPEQKLRVAKLYQSLGHIVAMTGDGVNDAPALKAANIGIAVGSGTEVAKGASDLVILDDNFGTIIAAIEEGRQTVSKIKKVIVYLLSNVADGLILIGGALLTGLAIPLNALQILWVNFFSDSFPALGLAFEEKIPDFSYHPSRLKDGLFDSEMKFLILIIGLSSSAFLFLLYYFLIYLKFAPELVHTFIFASFGTYTLILAYSVRSLKKSILNYGNLWSNPYLNFGIGIGLVLMLLAVYLPPLQNLLQTVPLPPLWLLGVALVGLLNIFAIELGKWLYRQN